MHDGDNLLITMGFGGAFALLLSIVIVPGCDQSSNVGDNVSVPHLHIESARILEEETRRLGGGLTSSAQRRQHGNRGSSTSYYTIEFWTENPPSAASLREDGYYEMSVKASDTRPTGRSATRPPFDSSHEYTSYTESPTVEETADDFDAIGGLIEVEMRRMQGLPDPPPPVVDIEAGVQVIEIEERETADGGTLYVVKMFVGGDSPSMFVTENAELVEFMRERPSVILNISEVPE